MPDSKDITYDEVAAIADRLMLEGKRVTLEYMRRELGKGTHAQIAVLLGRWQKAQKKSGASKHQASSYDKGRGAQEHKRFKGDNGKKNGLRRPDMSFRDKKQTSGKEYRNPPQYLNQRSSNGPARSSMGNFSLERLKKEHALVEKLFLSLMLVRERRVKALEAYQLAHNEALNARMDSEKEIREIKKENAKRLASLTAEFSKLKILNEREMASLRQKLKR
ncbi:DNA-binding protein [Fangia hongkongensis]|uniref:DNA-binding protein n=1 Tax=Fangia hongkongensis TaxID=270495 RepID=UPI00037465DB|nr:DNA-binding protein [Fangia hongkongensis]MBK2124365.1 DNA-binding protein [Fangia hongkongensis]